MRRVRSCAPVDRTYMRSKHPARWADDLASSAVNYEDFFENGAVGLHIVDADRTEVVGL